MSDAPRRQFDTEKVRQTVLEMAQFQSSPEYLENYLMGCEKHGGDIAAIAKEVRATRAVHEQFEVYDRFCNCIATFPTENEANDYVNETNAEEAYMMDIVRVSY